ncbi:hypothetical protein [Halovibrio sp. HP20-50]|nr:hypothetical protein [Halovibrio sp. HP20-59]MEA2120038.1 hypothetical protein [Halovibrio sp. HP20-59]
MSTAMLMANHTRYRWIILLIAMMLLGLIVTLKQERLMKAIIFDVSA